MLGRLPVLNITSYNGYNFPAAETIETLAYKLTATYDSARRTVTDTTFDMTIRWHIAAVGLGTTAAECEDMVARLQRPAGILQYSGRGFGVGQVVNRGNVWDADYGPRPGTIELEPAGNGLVIRCTWTVQFRIATCPDAVYKNAVREFCFAYDYQVDRSGLTTRTYKGHVSIAVTRTSVDSRVVPDSADRFLEDITPAPLLGFRRESQTRSLSEDKATLHLTVVDVEWPAFAPPPGSVDAQFEHTYSTQPGNWAKWSGTMTGTYEIVRSKGIGRDTQQAIQDFLTTADARLDRVATMIVGAGLAGILPGGVEGAGRPVTRKGIIPISFSVTEPNVFGRRQVRISMSYFVAGVGLSEILNKGGLWTNGGSQYNHWQATTPTLFLARGISNLVFDPKTEDRIVDLCGAAPLVVTPGATITVGGPLRPPSGPGAPGAPPANLNLSNQIQQIFPPPQPQASWIEYKNGITVHPDTGRVVGTTLPSSPLSTDRPKTTAWDSLRGITPGLPAGGLFPPLGSMNSSQSGGETFVQQRIKSTMYVTLAGHAVRVGYPIPIPELVSVNGKTPVLVGQPAFVQQVVGNAIVPVYAARWSLTYVFTDDGGIPTLPISVPPNGFLA